MPADPSKTVLILGANSDVARQAMLKYIARGDAVIAASRSTAALEQFAQAADARPDRITVRYFDAADFASHAEFYRSLPAKPHIVVYAAGFLVQNERALTHFPDALQMMKVHYAGAVSILNLVVADSENPHLERIVGLSSLSGVRGRKSNFVYGSSKAAFTTYLTGLRQLLYPRGVKVHIIVAGYIRSKMTAGLELTESLLLEPEFIARSVVSPGNRRTLVPGWKWKLIYQILRLLPERLVAKLP
ncbi:MAG: SDR family NAD(P)-dependent oxidoreductase [Bacteroidota bacterium]